ncbi:hypothetical protein [Shewanella aestuarii]|uniref:Uncharacterized protein n=1 Tax=Shewanella aestuarii TaxID=1028752 RepID=A0A6G9QQY1_9GAMM|nr:hypothetical protein [Shewanella aestuarii]QIR16447.1 hypothetical protein HBH39_18420 [Shewanella aestuarii]
MFVVEDDLSAQLLPSEAKIKLVKKYFLTLSRFRKFVMVNKDQIKQALNQHVRKQLKVLGHKADRLIIQRDCLVLLQLSDSI